MQFRARVDDGGRVRIVHLAGRLERAQVGELMKLVDEAPRPVRFDLSDLVSADAEGLDTLERLEGRGAELAGLSPYLALQLQMKRTARGQEPQGAGSKTDGRTGHRTRTTNDTEDE